MITNLDFSTNFIKTWLIYKNYYKFIDREK